MARAVSHVDREAFTNELELWHGRWEGFLRERTVGKDGKRTTYTHRTAAQCMSQPQTKHNVAMDIPRLSEFVNTNNAIEGVFTDIKTKLRVHSGITKDRRSALIQEYIARHY